MTFSLYWETAIRSPSFLPVVSDLLAIVISMVPVLPLLGQVLDHSPLAFSNRQIILSVSKPLLFRAAATVAAIEVGMAAAPESISVLVRECLDFCVQGGFQGGSQSRLSFVYRGLKINDQRLRGTLSRRQKCVKRHAEGSIIPCIIPSRW